MWEKTRLVQATEPLRESIMVFFSKGIRTGSCLGNPRGSQRGTNYSCVNVSMTQLAERA